MRYEHVSFNGAFALAPPNISNQKTAPLQNWRFNNMTSIQLYWSHPLTLEESILQLRLNSGVSRCNRLPQTPNLALKYQNISFLPINLLFKQANRPSL
jgi:hypothetical protein